VRDLLVVTPTRARPERIMRLASSINRTATAKTDLIVGLDDDDDTAAEVVEALKPYGVQCMRGPRAGLGPWSNTLVQAGFGDYKAYASLGDDHVPRTLGWDAECLSQLDAMGGGYVVPNGLLSPGLPEQVVISAPVVEALGWLCLPSLDHWYVDRAWYDFATITQRYRWLDKVMVEHWQDPSDQTGADAWATLEADRHVYATWLGSEQFAADVATVRKAIGA
jgi:hypothetical protein